MSGRCYMTSAHREARFWSKITKTATCWLWTGSTRGGYGRFKDHGKYVSVHRYSWVLAYGDIPLNMKVLHKCDVTNCVKPEHLFLGTQLTNMQDMYAKGRQRHPGFPGEANPHSKLTTEAVTQIRQFHLSGMSTIELAHKFSVTRETISKICRRALWKHV